MIINRFFWWCGGASVRILKPLDIEHARYFCSGATIFFTAVWATFAGGYAFYTVFPSYFAAVFFGLFWGGMIFNLDRYMIITMGKGDGTEDLTLNELKLAAPRLIMALILGIVIAKPLELRLFQGEIMAEIKKKELHTTWETSNESIANLDTLLSTLKPNLKYYQKLLTEGDQSVNSALSDWQSAEKMAIAEWEGKGESGVIGDGPIYKIKKQLADNLNLIYKNIRDEWVVHKPQIQETIKNLESQIESGENNAKVKVAEYETVNESNNGLMARLSALHEMSKAHREIRITNLLITLLFIIIEMAPVILKMMHRSGPYDYALEAEMRLMKDNERKKRDIRL